METLGIIKGVGVQSFRPTHPAKNTPTRTPPPCKIALITDACPCRPLRRAYSEGRARMALWEAEGAQPHGPSARGATFLAARLPIGIAA